jgi:NAD+ kinase
MTQKIALVRHTRPGVDQQAALVEAAVEDLGGRIVPEERAAEADIVLVLGGDGTILYATELVRGRPIPLLGVNFGHVGFLAEADPESLNDVVTRVVSGDYTVDERMTIELDVTTPDGVTTTGWALNEVALLKVDRARMIEVAFGVDGRAVSSFGCDGLVLATPTGSTAYAFSGGGPIVWPDVEALLVVPIAAHALFSRPLVVGPGSELTVLLDTVHHSDAEIWCDGRRRIPAPHGTTMTIRRSDEPVLLARLTETPFSGRLCGQVLPPRPRLEGPRTHA